MAGTSSDRIRWVSFGLKHLSRPLVISVMTFASPSRIAVHVAGDAAISGVSVAPSGDAAPAFPPLAEGNLHSTSA